jgi:uncharacterized protein involved in exopolysaccharide biosynthesis
MNEKRQDGIMPIKKEIDYMVLLRTCWNHRRTILLAAGIGFIIGIIIAFISPKSYKVITTMVPQSEEEGGMNQISSLAAMAGFNLNISSGESDISPILYPQIIESAPFMFDLMNTPFVFKHVDHPVSLFDYYITIKKPSLIDWILQYTIGLPGLIKQSMRGIVAASSNAKLIVLSKDQEDMIAFLKSNISLSVNKKEGYLTLTCTFEDPYLTAQVASRAQALLQSYITAYKINKSKDQLDFIEQRYREKRQDYFQAQQRLAAYQDRNQHVKTASAIAELERLQSENDLAFSVYTELAKSLEQAKIQVQRQTPVFAVIKPVVVPNQKYKPQRMKLILLYSFIGLVIGIGYIGIKEFFLRKAEN